MQDEQPEKEEIEIELDEERHAALVQIAAERGTTVDEVVEGFLRDAIAARRAEIDAEETRAAGPKDTPR